MKTTEALELILGTTMGILVGFILVQILTINPSRSQNLNSFFNSLKLTKFYVVSSGSMEPSLKMGSAVLVMPSESYLTGDVVTFLPNGVKSTPITHRIMTKQYPDTNSSPVYQTAGDANEDFDRWIVSDQDIVGKVAFSLPYFGYLVNFAKIPQGFILLVIIPATIIIYEELKLLKKELARLLKILLRRKALNNPEKDGPSFIRLASILPFLGASLIFAAVSSSFFFDEELSINNILSAATTFPQTTPPPNPFAQTLVINEVLPDSSCSQGNTEAQWIEVYNGYSVPVNLKNFKISDGVNTIDLVTANNIDVPSGGFALLSHNNAIWNHCYSNNGVITANLGGQLNIDTGFLMLFDSGGNGIDTVAWGAGTGLELTQDQSIEREPDGLDTAFGTNFNPADFQVKSPPAPGI